MKIAVVHNFYQFSGGEDEVFFSEKKLLEERGHQVFEFIKHNAEIKNFRFQDKLKFLFSVIYNTRSKNELIQFFKKVQPDVVHSHNFFPLISPAIFKACEELRLPVVQTLHNYRLMCLNALFYRQGRTCEDCLNDSSFWPGIKHACYRESRFQSGMVAAMLSTHHLLRTFQEKVDAFIVMTEFARRKFIQAGIPDNKMWVKPHFVANVQGIGDGKITNEYAIYVGRLSEEKGGRILLEACKLANKVPFKIVGDGPLLSEMRAFIKQNSLDQLELSGRVKNEEMLTLMRKARFLIFPSVCYETFGRSIIEAFSCGIPAIVSKIGAIEELVEDHKTGLHFTPGDPHDLAAKINWAWAHPAEIAEMGKNARREYEEKYTPEKNYQMLMEIYQKALENKR